MLQIDFYRQVSTMICPQFDAIQAIIMQKCQMILFSLGIFIKLFFLNPFKKRTHIINSDLYILSELKTNLIEEIQKFKKD